MWDKRYSTDEYVYGKAPNQFLAASVSFLPMGRVLCLAEGEGRNAVFLAKQGYAVTAVDSSAVGMAKAQRFAKDEGVAIETLVADLAMFPIAPAAWDGVVSIFCHVPEDVRRALHGRVSAGLRSGGVIVLEAYTPKQLEFGTGGPQEVSKLMTLASLREELQGIEFLRAQELERDVIEGTLHTGRGAVVQIIGTKR